MLWKSRVDDRWLGHHLAGGVGVHQLRRVEVFTPVQKHGAAAVSDFGKKSASGVHELAKKGVRAIGYDGRALSSATFQPDRAPNSCGPAHMTAMMCNGAVSGSNVLPLPGWKVEI